MITGRGPGAPGITPGLEFTRRPGGPGGTGHGAVDLSEIRRSEELIDRLAAREALLSPEAKHRSPAWRRVHFPRPAQSPSTPPFPCQEPWRGVRQGPPMQATRPQLLSLN